MEIPEKHHRVVEVAEDCEAQLRWIEETLSLHLSRTEELDRCEKCSAMQQRQGINEQQQLAQVNELLREIVNYTVLVTEGVACVKEVSEEVKV